MPFRHVTLHQLKIFHVLARHLSITRSAEALHLTPAAVSIQVKQLADGMGLQLTEQIGKKLYLTAAGQTVAAASADIMERLEQLAQELAALQGMERGQVRLAIISGAKYFAPRLLGKFCAAHPGIEAALFVGNREELLHRLKNNEDDLYILGLPPKEVSVVAEAFADNLLVLVAHPQHPLAAKQAVTAEELREYPLILREPGSGIRLATLDFFDKHEVPLKVRMELGSNEAIKQCVMAGLGISVLSLNNIGAQVANGQISVLDVQGFPLKRHWYVAHQPGKVLSSAVRAFRDFILSEGISAPDA